MPSLTRQIPNDSDMARKILQEIKVRVRMSEKLLTEKHKQWREAEERTLAYVPESDVDALRRVEREGGAPQYTTIQIPYSYAVLLSAHTYLTSVFMGRNPILQFAGRHGESEQQVQAVEAIADYQVRIGRHMVPIYTWLYDAGKYGAGMLGQYWEDRVERITRIEEIDELDMVGQATGRKRKVQSSQLFPTYSGNRIYNIQPWDFLWDVRYPLRDFQRGEYCATRFALGWNECKRREVQGYYMNLKDIGPGSMWDTYGNNDGAAALVKPEAHSNQWWPDADGDSGVKRDHPMLVRGYECHIEIIPKEWGLGASDFPERWVFTCTADFKVLIGCQPLGAYHAKFPFHVLPLECEAYGLMTNGYPETLRGVQNTIDWLINSHFYNVRAALNNKVVVDPSKVVMKDVLNPLPGGVIRLKPSAYGQDARTAIQQMQIMDVTQNNLRDLQMMFGIGERAVGVNDQVMGLVNSGGRKTATEVRTSTSFSVNRLKTTAEWFSMVGFDPYSQMLIQNTQQYYSAEMKFKIAGDLMFTRGAEKFLQVTPQDIMGFYDFVPVDGTLPIDRFAQANLWKELMLQSRQNPQLALGYDWVGIFEWIAQLAGLKNITRFKLNIASPEQLAVMSQAGNIVPLNGKGPSGTANSRPPPIQVGGNPSEASPSSA